MHMAVDDAREQVQPSGVDLLLGGGECTAAPKGDDFAVVYGHIKLLTAIGVDDRGVADYQVNHTNPFDCGGDVSIIRRDVLFFIKSRAAQDVPRAAQGVR
jgi:hypothetical protein